ncbi:MAG: EF-P lysine aminoacylase GenX [Parachlamydiaceae bacterium]|nr:EF-P lysine aminoacylase GenX [Parachlamydiaceae bacterium]
MVYSSKIARLRDRAFMLKEARTFFDQLDIKEVDCPLLTVHASVDSHIDLIPALYNQKETRYLHSSPEYGMKRLLAEGIGDIFQLTHVFRNGEWSTKHNPEFMMAEWYRLGITFETMIDETVQFIRLFLGDLPYSIISYRDAFLRYAGIDYLTMSFQDLVNYIDQAGIPFYPSAVEEGKDALLNLILGTQIEPQLGQDELCVLAYYPSSQAALAKTRLNGQEEVAERFEIYYQGVELSNGYHELTDVKEQKERFKKSNQMRKMLGKEELPIDEYFLKALDKGIPDCCGVAVGFDRLMMLRQKQKNIAEVISWGWEFA